MTMRDLYTFRPSPVRWPMALQAALSIAVPSVGFALVGHPALGLLASSGAFVALYLGHRSRRWRARLLPLVAAGLLVASGAGILSSSGAIASVIAIAAIAILATALCLGLNVGPPGALFFVLVSGVSNHLAAPASRGGAGIDGWLAFGLLALGCLIAYLIVLAPLVLPASRRRDSAVHVGQSAPRFGFDAVSRVILLRVSVAVVLASAIALPLGVQRGYWVVVTVVAILQNGPRLSLTAVRTVHRIVGTLIGIGLFAAITGFQPSGVVLGLLLATLQFIVELLIIRNYGLALAFITPLALTLALHGTQRPITDEVGERVLDTLVGAAIALIVLLATLAVRVIGRDRWRRVDSGGS